MMAFMASPFAPKKPAWFAGSVAATAAALLVYAVSAALTPWRAGRSGGLVYGTIAAVIFLIDALYPLRRRLLGWPFGTAQRWLQFHIYGGVFAAICVFVHVGFAAPRGAMGWWLLGLSLWTTASGLFGVALQKWIPTVIAGTLRVEALASRVPQLTARLAQEADDLMVGASERLCAAYQSDIRAWLGRPEPAWAYVTNVQAGRLRYSQSLDRLDRSAADRERLNKLRAIVFQKSELDVHLSLQRALRAWVWVHVPPAFALLGLLAVHVFAVLYF
jgi:hypothetical protein